jgi:hypothetical protein
MNNMTPFARNGDYFTALNGASAWLTTAIPFRLTLDEEWQFVKFKFGASVRGQLHQT